MRDQFFFFPSRARIPHFYYDYYVYQYATGCAATQPITEALQLFDELIDEMEQLLA